MTNNMMVPTFETRIEAAKARVRMNEEIVQDLLLEKETKMEELNKEYNFKLKDMLQQIATIKEDIKLYKLLAKVRDGVLVMHYADTGKQFKVGFTY